MALYAVHGIDYPLTAAILPGNQITIPIGNIPTVEIKNVSRRQDIYFAIDDGTPIAESDWERLAKDTEVFRYNPGGVHIFLHLRKFKSNSAGNYDTPADVQVTLSR